MAVDPITWANDMRAAIAQMVGSFRVIQNAETMPEWKPYFDAWTHDPSLSKDTRKTIKSLMPAVLSMADDLDDVLLTEIGIDVAALPQPVSFDSQSVPAPKGLRIAQVDMHESPSETSHEILVLTKPTRTCMLSIHQVSDGVAVGLASEMVEVSDGVFTHTIDWSILPVLAGYYIVKVVDEHELDAVLVELRDPPQESHTQADKVWMMQNASGSVGGGGGSYPPAKAEGSFI